MQSEERAEPRRVDLLRLNYENLHTSVSDAHRLAWTATSIFMPIVFTLQGLLVREHGHLTIYGVVAGVVVVEALALMWLMMMKLLRQYNHQRIEKLAKIEETLDPDEGAGSDPKFRQYKGFDYSMEVMGVEVSPGRLYRGLFAVCSLINLSLVLLKQQGFDLSFGSSAGL